MNIIRNYLDNMFLGLPQTDEVARAKNELLTMMEDKYNELKNEGRTENEAIGIVISEFGNLDELGDTLGIKKALTNKSEISVVSYEEAKNYIEDSQAIAPKTAYGVLLCIISPVVLLSLIGLKENNMVGVREDTLIAAGLAVLLCLVAAGVWCFIKYTGKLEKYESYQYNIFTLDYKTEQMVRMVREQDEQPYKSAVSISVMCYIISPLPIIFTSLLSNKDYGVFSVVVTLIIVAIATYNIINKRGAYEACNVLLQEGDYSVKKKTNKTYQVVSKAYWCVIVAIYLAYSFITNNWGMSWIIWPVAGVLFGAIKVVLDGR